MAASDNILRRIDRLDIFLALQRLSSRKAASLAALSNGLLSKARKKGCDLSDAASEKILKAFPEISSQWLLHGFGEMWNRENSFSTFPISHFTSLETAAGKLKNHPSMQKALKIIAQSEDNLLCAVSGGADSVAILLLSLLAGKKIVVANCNFHLRGAESDRDSEFVEKLCRHLHAELVPLDFDVAAYRNENGGSLEMACRNLRYDAFRRISSQRGLNRIVTGHNADDQAETLLLNLMRGCGLNGLKGMEEDNGEILRPLLGVTRSEIVAWLDDCQQGYVSDSSNFIADVDRNFLRLRLIPLLEERWQDARRSLCIAARNAAGALPFFNRGIAQAISSPLLLSRKEAIRSRPFAELLTLIHEFLDPYGTSRQIDEEVARCCRAGMQSGKVWHLKAAKAVTTKRGLFIDNTDFSTVRLLSESVKTASLSPSQILEKMKSEGQDVCFTPLPHHHFSLRTPRKGEKMHPLGAKGKRLIADILADADIPVTQRAVYPVMVDENDECVWIPGVKRSSLHTVSFSSLPAEIYRYSVKFPQKSNPTDAPTIGKP